MRELYKILAKDIQSEHFTNEEIIIYGFIFPLVLIAICLIA